MDTLGTALTKYWHLGDDVMRMSRRLPVDAPVHKAMDDVELLRQTASLANELVDCFSLPETRRRAALDVVTRRYAKPLGIGAKDVQEALSVRLEKARERAVERPARPTWRANPATCVKGCLLAAPICSVPPRGPRHQVITAMDPVPTLGRFRSRRLGRAPRRRWLGMTRCWTAKSPSGAAAGTELGSVDEWLHEARAVSRLNHPHIVPVFRGRHQNGQSYLVFEYVEGGTLADRLRDHRRMPAREAVGLLLAVLDALTAATPPASCTGSPPTNILLRHPRPARVMDFGIAARVSASAALVAHPERIVGTPGYSAPRPPKGGHRTPAWTCLPLPCCWPRC